MYFWEISFRFVWIGCVKTQQTKLRTFNKWIPILELKSFYFYYYHESCFFFLDRRGDCKCKTLSIGLYFSLCFCATNNTRDFWYVQCWMLMLKNYNHLRTLGQYFLEEFGNVLDLNFISKCMVSWSKFWNNISYTQENKVI